MESNRTVNVSRHELRNYWNRCSHENRAFILNELREELGAAARIFDLNSALKQPFDDLPKPIARMVESRLLASVEALYIPA